MATPERNGKRPRIDAEEDESMNDARLIAIEKLQEIQDEIDKVNMLSTKKLQEIQDEIEKVKEEAYAKVLELEQKCNEVPRPVYAQRNELIRKIPDFWRTAFICHRNLSELLNFDDQLIFRHLESIDVDEFQDIKSGYSITFTFSSNPYFEDTKLTKTFS